MEKLIQNSAATMLAIHDAGIHRYGSFDILDETGYDTLRRCIPISAVLDAAVEMLNGDYKWSDEDRAKMADFIMKLSSGV